MLKDYTHISIVLDRSGSMATIKDKIIDGFNELIESQKHVAGKCTISLVQFDDMEPYQVLKDMEDVDVVTKLGDEYFPRGMTPMYDAIGKAIQDTGEKLSKLPESLRPDKVVFAVMTDGLENASKEFTASKIKEMTEHQTNVYNWQFMYLGANQDAILEGSKMGFSMANSSNYAVQNAGSGLACASAKMSEYRISGDIKKLSFSSKERTELEKV